MTLDQFAQIRVNEFSERDNDSPFYQLLEKIPDRQICLAVEAAVSARVWEIAYIAYIQGFKDAMAPHEEAIVI